MEPKYRTGLQRFHDRYPKYIIVDDGDVIGVGVMMVPPMDTRDMVRKFHDQLFIENMRDY